MDMPKPRVVAGDSCWWVRIPGLGWYRQGTWEQAIELALCWRAEQVRWRPDVPKET